MKPEPSFIFGMDRKTSRSVGVLLAMFIVTGFILWAARHYLAVSDNAVSSLLGFAQDSPFGLPLTVLVFCFAAFIGAPQWVLIAGAVAAFGPVTGGPYAWIATLTSASLDFALARQIGAKRLEALGGGFTARIREIILTHGAIASFAVRLVPTGPFVLVNMAAGISGMRFWSFFAGTALGIIPKILLVVLLGQGLVSAEKGKVYMAGFGLAAILLLGVMILARRWLSQKIEP